MAGKSSLFLRPTGLRESFFHIFLQCHKLATVFADADPEHFCGSAEYADVGNFDSKCFMAGGDFFDYFADLRRLLVGDLAEKFYRQVHEVGLYPSGLAFFEMSVGTDIFLQVGKRRLNGFVNIYGYEYSHNNSSFAPLNTSGQALRGLGYLCTCLPIAYAMGYFLTPA